MPRYLNENDIANTSEQMLDIPDDGSEDGFESDEAEEFNVNTIQRLLEAADDSSDLLQNSHTHLNSTPNSCSESSISTIALCSQLDNSQPEEPLIVQSSSPLEQELTDESECEDESWGKDFWTSRPDPDEFDKVKIKPRYLLNRRARPVAHYKKFFSDEVFDLIVTQTNLYAEQQNISKRWWLRIFYFLVDASLTNSFILYSLTSRVEKLTNLEFRVAVARGLIGGYSSRKRRSSLAIYIYKKSRIACPEVYQKTVNAVPEELRFVNVGDHMPAELETYRRCKLCSTKVKDKRSKIKCSKCNVPLCITPCFAQFHRK